MRALECMSIVFNYSCLREQLLLKYTEYIHTRTHARTQTYAYVCVEFVSECIWLSVFVYMFISVYVCMFHLM